MRAASAGRLLVGLGVSVVFVGLMKSNSVWFSERKYGFISGLTVLLGNVGSVLAAGPLAAVLNVYSWRSVFVAIGIISIGLALVSWLVVRNRPEDAGFPSLREMQGKGSHPPRERHWMHDLRSVLLNRRIWPGFWINFGMGGSLFSFAGLWGIPLLRDVYGLERGAAAAYTTLTLVGLAWAVWPAAGCRITLDIESPSCSAARCFTPWSGLPCCICPGRRA